MSKTVFMGLLMGIIVVVAMTTSATATTVQAQEPSVTVVVRGADGTTKVLTLPGATISMGGKGITVSDAYIQAGGIPQFFAVTNPEAKQQLENGINAGIMNMPVIHSDSVIENLNTNENTNTNDNNDDGSQGDPTAIPL